jgi:hypothetical protein
MQQGFLENMQAIFAPYHRLNRQLRAVMNEVRAAIEPATDESSVATTLPRVRNLVDACRARLRYEDQILRPALVPSVFGIAGLTEIDYLRDELACDAFEADLADIAYGVCETRSGAIQALHRRLEAFVATTLVRVDAIEHAMRMLMSAPVIERETSNGPLCSASAADCA